LSHHKGSGRRAITEKFKGPKTDWIKIVGGLCLAACRWLVVVGRFGGLEIWERKRRKMKGRRYSGSVTLRCSSCVSPKGSKVIRNNGSPTLP
jgi:hypothetical protein